MSNKKQTQTPLTVFEILIEQLKSTHIASDGEGIGDCLTNEEKQAYMKDYDTALPDETDNQKSCPYCHSKSGHKISQDAYSFWYRNKRFKPLFCSNCGRKL
ncbi:hypothetical protein [Lacticaseibacillus paracasei]|uniref:hypothetical protein n=1 Tax=Lacticaseibacillus paracasei TaxID=1597 RepID=UPI0031D1EECD